MTTAEEYVSNYHPPEAEKIAFAWNGKHSSEFVDANQDFRWEVIKYCIEHPEKAPVPLLEDLFRADAAWSREAWCAHNYFHKLAAILLIQGGGDVLDTFVEGLYSSFDTYGTCTGLQLPPDVLQSLLPILSQRVSDTLDPDRRKHMEGALELLQKLADGTASKGWAKVDSGTPVKNLRVVWPRWYHRFWQRIKYLWHERKI